MYEMIIGNYIRKLTINDINNFANSNNISLLPEEDKILYNFMNKYWKEAYKGDINKVFKELKKQVSESTYNCAINLYNKYKYLIK